MSAKKNPQFLQPTVMKDKLQEYGAFGPVIGYQSLYNKLTVSFF